MAADCAVMVIDLAKGVETQTEKLFRVCALRKILVIWGVEHFLHGFLKLCLPPGDRASDTGPIAAVSREFAGFVFKIQANLDPRHRDRIVFVRVCAGRFRRDMEVLHTRTGEKLRLRRAHWVFGRERETMDEAVSA